MAKQYRYKYSNPFNLDDMDNGKDSIHSLPFWIGFVVVFTLSVLFGIVILIDGILPTPLTIEDEADHLDSFITDRAVQDLKYLTDLGPRVTGSYQNEYSTVEYLLLHIRSVISEANVNQFIEVDSQEATGSYFLEDALGFVNIYDKVQNIVVKLHGHNNETHSILINSHFDSVPTSPGASDAGINIVAMMEILRKLSKRDAKLMQNVIFLFNGAEETPLQAAHGFLAHHRWAKESKYVINLEASGNGGKIILFQTGPETPWLAKYYSEVPHPYGTVFAEEIFQSGIIPSDTDFRIFRDFGDMIGADLAFIRDGYRYHTEFDIFDSIPLGSYQHVGDNVLSFVKSLANAPEILEREHSTGKAVYFDVFGIFMVTYSTKTATIVNLVTAALSLSVFLLSLLIFRIKVNGENFRYFVVTTLAILGSWLIATIFVMVLAVVLDLLNKTMSWYAHPWTIFGLYVVPTIGLSGCLLYFTRYKFIYFQNFSLNVRGQIQVHLVRLIWTFVLVLGTALKVRSVYFFLIPILFNSIGFLLVHIFRLQHLVGIWLIIHVASLVLPILYMLYIMLFSFVVFIPITGRFGAQLNPEFIVAAQTLFFTIAITSPLTVLTNFLRKAKLYYFVLIGIFLLFVGLLYTPVTYPYSSNANCPRAQRHWIMHTQRDFYNESGQINNTESGFFMLHMDRNSPDILKPYVKELANVRSLDEDCKRYTLCGLPLTHPKVAKKLSYSDWIPTSHPEFPANETLKFSVVSKEEVTITKVKYTIEVSGPDKLVFYFTPREHVKFMSSSLSEYKRASSVTFQDRPVYIFLYQRGKTRIDPIRFNVLVEKPPAFTGPLLDVGVSGRYVHQSSLRKTPAYLSFLNQFPQWTHVISWLAAYQFHIL